MKKINKLLTENPRYRRLQKPLEAAKICDAARELSSGQWSPISFSKGLLTLGVDSSSRAATLQSEKAIIIEKINQKIGERVVEKVRFKIVI